MPTKKKATLKAASPKLTGQKLPALSPRDYGHLVTAIQSASDQTVYRAVVVVNRWLVIRNWLVGAYLVEYEQNGSDRAKYGTKLLERLAEDLAKRKVTGFTTAVLRSCRLVYQAYPQIRQTVSVELLGRVECPEIRQTLSIESRDANPIPSAVITELSRAGSSPEIPYTVSTELGVPIRQTLSAEFRLTKKAAAIRGSATRELPTPCRHGSC